MNDFVNDTWQDLRDKRLWPIAVALLVAIVAVPVVLAKSSTAPAPVADTAPAVVETTNAMVALDTDVASASGKGSSLGVFSPDDPFVPPRSSVRAESSVDSVDVVAAGSGEGVDVSVGGGEGDAGGETVDVQIPREPRTETRTTAYEYVADVSFWQGERRRRIEGLRKLDMLPNEAAPILIFMGATGDGGNASFLVDSTLKTAGEGNCRPSGANCAFVDIGPGSEHVFTSEEGESFRLRVEEIRRVKVRAAASASSSPRARSSAGDAPTRRFALPSLVDLVEVDTTTTTEAPKADSRKSGRGR